MPNSIVHLFQTEDDAESLDTLLDNEEMRHYFVEFLAKRFQVEYIFFLIQVMHHLGCVAELKQPLSVERLQKISCS